MISEAQLVIIQTSSYTRRKVDLDDIVREKLHPPGLIDPILLTVMSIWLWSAKNTPLWQFPKHSLCNSDPVPLQFLEPCSGCAMGEHLDNKRHALTIHEDLLQQSVAHREMPLSVRQPPGGEAFLGEFHSENINHVRTYLIGEPMNLEKDQKFQPQRNSIVIEILSLWLCLRGIETEHASVDNRTGT